MLQELSDSASAKTEFDKFVDPNGQINLQKLTASAQTILLGLITAKAKVCFSMADLNDLSQLKQKKSSILCLGFLISIFIVVKLLAEQDYSQLLQKVSGSDHPSVGCSESYEIDAGLFWSIYHGLLALSLTSILGYSSHRLEQETGKLYRIN